LRKGEGTTGSGNAHGVRRRRRPGGCTPISSHFLPFLLLPQDCATVAAVAALMHYRRPSARQRNVAAMRRMPRCNAVQPPRREAPVATACRARCASPVCTHTRFCRTHSAPAPGRPLCSGCERLPFRYTSARHVACYAVLFVPFGPYAPGHHAAALSSHRAVSRLALSCYPPPIGASQVPEYPLVWTTKCPPYVLSTQSSPHRPSSAAT
jgi:hypothetical protein